MTRCGCCGHDTNDCILSISGIWICHDCVFATATGILEASSVGLPQETFNKSMTDAIDECRLLFSWYHWVHCHLPEKWLVIMVLRNTGRQKARGEAP